MIQSSLMEVNGLVATINTPEALKGEDVYNLPPYDECPAFNVDKYPACPPNWMHGSDKASSYFVPVRSGRGMWFDFTQNEHHSHHVAVVISVQGVNPITGQRVKELNLEQYRNKCPVHDVDFQGFRFCPECGYSWPAQNYLANTSSAIFWIDGFRNEQGQVRQYIITEEEIRSVAKAIIGDDRVYAIGFAFYLSKNPKQKLMARQVPFGGKKESWLGKLSNVIKGFPASSTISPSVRVDQEDYWIPTRNSGVSLPDQIVLNTPIPSQINCSLPPMTMPCMSVPENPGYPNDDACSLQQLASGDANLDIFYSTQYDPNTGEEYSMETGEVVLRDTNNFVDLSGVPNRNSRVYSRKALETQLEIGAGAKISQEIGIDPQSIEFWQSEPAGMIYVNYVTPEKAKEIIAAGERAEKKEGFLQGIPVGN